MSFSMLPRSWVHHVDSHIHILTSFRKVKSLSDGLISSKAAWFGQMANWHFQKLKDVFTTMENRRYWSSFVITEFVSVLNLSPAVSCYDGNEGNGLKLQTLGKIISSSVTESGKKMIKNYYDLLSLINFLPLYFTEVFCVQVKVLRKRGFDVKTEKKKHESTTSNRSQKLEVTILHIFAQPTTCSLFVTGNRSASFHFSILSYNLHSVSLVFWKNSEVQLHVQVQALRGDNLNYQIVAKEGF